MPNGIESHEKVTHETTLIHHPRTINAIRRIEGENKKLGFQKPL